MAETQIYVKHESELSGEEILNNSEGISREKREKYWLELFKNGNVPRDSLALKRIKFEYENQTLEIDVLPDYLRLGNNEDSFIVPLWPITAQNILDDWDCLLPTTPIVDKIWWAAKYHFQPHPIPPDSQMMSTKRIRQHHQILMGLYKVMGVVGYDHIIAGHKKDVVITNKMIDKPKRVAIYGWHQIKGFESYMINSKPIQPLYLGHIDSYADYSHGIRAVSRWCWIDDQQYDLHEILRDEKWAPVLSDDKKSLKITEYPY